MKSRLGALGAFLILAAGLLLGPAAVRAADPDALWKIVHDRCVPHQLLALDPAPCAFVSLGGPRAPGFAVLKDRVGATQYLLIPTDRITGIEDPRLQRPGTEAYIERAWAFRALVFARLGHELPDTDVALAINSVSGRSQNQLHIHIDCLRADVRDALRRDQASIGPELKPLAEPLAGQRYLAMALPAAGLKWTNLFHLLARRTPAGTMGRETLVLAGAMLPSGRPGFDVLVGRADPAGADRGSGEELQDHACAVNSDAPSAR